MEPVRARLDDHVGRRADVAAVLGGRTAGLHRDLGERGCRYADPAAAELRERGVDAIDEHALVGEVRAVDRRTGLLDVVVLRVGGDAGQSVDDAVVGAGDAADLLADLAGDGGARGDVELVDHGRLARDGDFALDRRLEGEIERGAVAGHGAHLGRGFAEAFQRGGQRVVAGRHADEPVVAVLVGDAELVPTLAAQRDAHAGQRGTAGVNYPTADRCRFRRVGKGADGQEQQQRGQKKSLHRDHPPWLVDETTD